MDGTGLTEAKHRTRFQLGHWLLHERDKDCNIGSGDMLTHEETKARDIKFTLCLRWTRH